MESKVYAIKDVKIGFNFPFVYVNDAVAVREFGNLVNSGSSQVAVNYQDMELWCLGTYNSDTGVLVSDVSYVCKGVDVKEVNANA